MNRLAQLQELIRPLLEHRLVRYGFSGGLTFLVNMAAIWVCVEWMGLGETELRRNVAHFIGAEVSILFSFHAHNFWTWRTGFSGYWGRLLQFHLLTAGTIVLRQVGFSLLDRAGYHWFISTVCPLIIAIVINFMGYDRYIFSRLRKKEE